MILLRRVRGLSMSPGLRPEQLVIFIKTTFRPGDIVLVRRRASDTQEIIKRIKSVQNGRVYVVGDNEQSSYDSRHFGAVPASAILGVMKLKFPVAQPPRAAKYPADVWLGRGVAVFVAGLLAAQIFRIDTFLPYMGVIIPQGKIIAMLTLLAMFACLPFALRLPMSPAGRVTAGVMLIVAPVSWLLMSGWVAIHRSPAGTFPFVGDFWAIPATIVFLVSAVWLVAGLFCLQRFGLRNQK